MENKTITEILDAKVSNVLEKYKTLQNQNTFLNENITQLKREIDKLKEENAMKDLEIEDIISKVENILK
jgi:peptidoglycan hydrolase CwlO-like protein